MKSFVCPFCRNLMTIQSDTYSFRYPSAERDNDSPSVCDNNFDDSTLKIAFYVCPKCGETSINIIGVGKQVKGLSQWFRPNSSAKKYPDCIPPHMLRDYEEACSIVSLSPKSSAALSRRCLQEMIRDFWGIKMSCLAKEIEEAKSVMPVPHWEILESLRCSSIGDQLYEDVNKIIDTDLPDAKKLIKVIELFFQLWYIDRYTLTQLFIDFREIDREVSELHDHPEK